MKGIELRPAIEIVPGFQSKELEDLAKKYLSKETLEATSKKATSQVICYDDGRKFISTYLGVIVKNENIEKGVAEISRALNDLASKGYIHSCLIQMSSVEMAKIPKQHDCSAVLSYVLTPVEKDDEIKLIADKFLITPQGLTSDHFDNLNINLPEGQFFVEVQISLASSLINKKNTEETVKEKIDEYLSILPKGTQIISVKKCAIISLALDYEVVLYHPLMKSFREVKLTYERHAEVIDDKIEQFSLLRSVEYIKRDAA
jgi:hypothetical protein